MSYAEGCEDATLIDCHSTCRPKLLGSHDPGNWTVVPSSFLQSTDSYVFCPRLVVTQVLFKDGNLMRQTVWFSTSQYPASVMCLVLPVIRLMSPSRVACSLVKFQSIVVFIFCVTAWVRRKARCSSFVSIRSGMFNSCHLQVSGQKLTQLGASSGQGHSQH